MGKAFGRKEKRERGTSALAERTRAETFWAKREGEGGEGSRLCGERKNKGGGGRLWGEMEAGTWERGLCALGEGSVREAFGRKGKAEGILG